MLLCVVALAACAKTEDKAADTTTPAAAAPAPAPTLSLADVAGTWEGAVKPMDKDTTLATVTLTATATNDGWSMKLSNGETVPLTVASVAGDSVVTTGAGFKSAVKKGRSVKTLHSISHFQNGQLSGVTHATYDNGDTATYRTVYTKK
jgi:hypothetical protein